MRHSGLATSKTILLLESAAIIPPNGGKTTVYPCSCIDWTDNTMSKPLCSFGVTVATPKLRGKWPSPMEVISSPLAVFTVSVLGWKFESRDRSLTNDTWAPLSTNTLSPLNSRTPLAAIINTEVPINCKHIGKKRWGGIEEGVEKLLSSEEFAVSGCGTYTNSSSESESSANGGRSSNSSEFWNNKQETDFLGEINDNGDNSSKVGDSTVSIGEEITPKLEKRRATWGWTMSLFELKFSISQIAGIRTPTSSNERKESKESREGWKTANDICNAFVEQKAGLPLEVVL